MNREIGGVATRIVDEPHAPVTVPAWPSADRRRARKTRKNPMHLLDGQGSSAGMARPHAPVSMAARTNSSHTASACIHTPPLWNHLRNAWMNPMHLLASRLGRWRRFGESHRLLRNPPERAMRRSRDNAFRRSSHRGVVRRPGTGSPRRRQCQVVLATDPGLERGMSPRHDRHMLVQWYSVAGDAGWAIPTRADPDEAGGGRGPNQP